VRGKRRRSVVRLWALQSGPAWGAGCQTCGVVDLGAERAEHGGGVFSWRPGPGVELAGRPGRATACRALGVVGRLDVFPVFAVMKAMGTCHWWGSVPQVGHHARSGIGHKQAHVDRSCRGGSCRPMVLAEWLSTLLSRCVQSKNSSTRRPAGCSRGSVET